MASSNMSMIAPFYNNKTILTAWNFEVDFSSMELVNYYVTNLHVVDIQVPSWNFKQNTIKYGSVLKNYTTLDSDTSYKFDVVLEDDDRGSIVQLVYMLQKTIMDEYGVYKSLKAQLLGDCIVRLYNQNNTYTVASWTMENCRFLGADDLNLSYNNAESLKVKLSFSCDNMSYEGLDDIKRSESNTLANEINTLGIDNTYDYPKEHDAVNFRQTTPPRELSERRVDRGTYYNF